MDFGGSSSPLSFVVSPVAVLAVAGVMISPLLPARDARPPAIYEATLTRSAAAFAGPQARCGALAAPGRARHAAFAAGAHVAVIALAEARCDGFTIPLARVRLPGATASAFVDRGAVEPAGAD